jgi:hypothetical protein
MTKLRKESGRQKKSVKKLIGISQLKGLSSHKERPVGSLGTMSESQHSV